MRRDDHVGPDSGSRLSAPSRLGELEASGLVESVTVAALDALTRVAYEALGGAAALVTAVTADKQVVVSATSDAAPGEYPREHSLSHSLCRHVVVAAAPFIVEDAAQDPRTRTEPVVTEWGLAAYAGFPVRGPRGEVVGAMCAVSDEPRAWTAVELQILGSLSVAAEFVVASLTMARRDRLERTHSAVPLDQFQRIQHGIRTPLTSLLGFLELLLDGTLGDFTPEQHATLQRCRRNADQLRQAVDDLR